MPEQLEIAFNAAMINIYHQAKSEAKYNAQRFLQMVVDHGGLEAAKMLIHSENVSDGYTALWERGRLDLTVEAMIVESPKFHSLFSDDEMKICLKRLSDYRYETKGGGE